MTRDPIQPSHRSRSELRLARLLPLLLAGTALTSPASAGELPQGGSVAYGSVGIGQPAGNRLSIQQSSQTAIVNWQGFSIGQGAAGFLRFNVAQCTDPRLIPMLEAALNECVAARSEPVG